MDDKYFVFTSLNTDVKYNEQICHTQVFSVDLNEV